MKKFISILMTLVFAMSMMIGCSAAENTTEDFVLTMQVGNPVMTVNGTEQNIDNEGTMPVIVNDRTLVPIRAIIEAMDGTVGWEQATQTATLNYGDDEIQLVIDSATAYLNGTASTLDTAPTIINDRTMLPIRFIAESFKFKVDWTEDSQTVTISKAGDILASDDSLVATAEPTQSDELADKNGKTLITYFSRAGENYGVGVIDVGNTAVIAGYIDDAIDADVFEIVAKEPYPVGYEDTKTRVQQEMNENARPEFVGEIDNIDQYDTVYLGYPIWYGTMPLIINTFLEKYDMTGKTIIPFSTAAGSGWGSSLTDLKALCPNAEFLDGYTTAGSNVGNAREEVNSWLNGLNK